MDSSFDHRIDVALHDLHLQQALGYASQVFLAARDRVASALPEWEELRSRANAIKRDTIENLPRYLDQVETAVRARGGEVFRAADARVACDYVAAVARRRGTRLIVKSKSMATEEAGLNHALAAAGIEAVETDLGEYIIQLAGEKPSHIVAPAIHKTRQDVARLLREKLGADVGDDDIPRMAAIARAHLRKKFLSAGVGVSGVNFAVAESGTIVIVENEGNARLTNSLPGAHVAVMGIEKVIPRVADLAVFLKLLARSATGQKMSSYVSFITGPRRAGEPDGPEEFHLILLDNGRSRLLGHPLRREALYCIRCGACLNACPVYRKIGGHAYPWVYSGPIGAVLTPQILPQAEPKLPFASSLCGACREICPVKIRIPELLLELRKQEVETAPQRHRWEKLAFRLWAWTMERPWAYSMAGRTLRALGWALPSLPGPAAIWASTRELPQPAKTPFREAWRERRKMNL